MTRQQPLVGHVGDDQFHEEDMQLANADAPSPLYITVVLYQPIGRDP
jgi:hypothetical protein